MNIYNIAAAWAVDREFVYIEAERDGSAAAPAAGGRGPRGGGRGGLPFRPAHQRTFKIIILKLISNNFLVDRVGDHTWVVKKCVAYGGRSTSVSSTLFWCVAHTLK